MGSNEVGLNDTRYQDRLKKRVWEEYQARLDREEKEREEAELTRMRRLLKSGQITTEEMKQDEIMYEEYKRLKAKYGGRPLPSQRNSTSAKSKRKKTRSSRPVTSHATSGSRDFWPAPGETTPHRAGTRSMMSVRYSDRPKSSVSSRRTRFTGDEEDEQNNCEDKDQREDDREEERPQSPFFNKFTDPLLTELAQQETIEDLYRIAEEILDGKLPSQRKIGGTKAKKTTSD